MKAEVVGGTSLEDNNSTASLYTKDKGVHKKPKSSIASLLMCEEHYHRSTLQSLIQTEPFVLEKLTKGEPGYLTIGVNLSKLLGTIAFSSFPITLVLLYTARCSWKALLTFGTMAMLYTICNGYKIEWFA